MPKHSRVARALAGLSVLVVACSNVAGPTAEPLTARVGAAMAFDEARQQMILFGGVGAEGASGRGDRASTWTWDGTTWSRLATTGPTGRRQGSMTYDANRQRIVLFGGQIGDFPNSVILRDTWEWDGAAWTKRAEGGPPSRVHQSIAYDRARGRVVLYGGFDPSTMTEYKDIWEWNGTTWQQSPASPAGSVVARGIAFDEKLGASLLFSAAADGSVVVDSYDGSAVTRLSTAPPCVPMHLAGLGPNQGVLLYSAACGASPQSWRWNGTTWQQVASQPTTRYQAAMAYDRRRDRVVIFGGEVAAGIPDLSDTWEYDGTAWTKR